jgi:hypothetical protein
MLQDRLPAYITWEEYQRNLRQLEANQVKSQGAVRQGPSLLPGLVTCGRCGLRMVTTYRNNGHGLRYSCNRMAVDYGEAPCQSLAGTTLDNLVAKLVLQALEPAALELSLQVAEDLEAERKQLHQQWDQRLERARYAADLAFRQYRAVEPENRLVARTLERQWEETLAAEADLQREHLRFLTEQPATLSAQERAAIKQLSSDIPALWEVPSTSAADRQAIIRQLVERVVVTVHGESEQVEVQVHWRGGDRIGSTLIRSVARLEQLSYYPQLLARVRTLHAQGYNGAAIARVHGTTGEVPQERLAVELPSLLHLPQAPYIPRITLGRRINKDGFISYNGNEYSVPEQLGQGTVQIRATLTEVRLFQDDRLVAAHPVLEGRGQRRLAAGHRGRRKAENPQESNAESPWNLVEVQRRSLEVYERVLS